MIKIQSQWKWWLSNWTSYYFNGTINSWQSDGYNYDNLNTLSPLKLQSYICQVNNMVKSMLKVEFKFSYGNYGDKTCIIETRKTSGQNDDKLDVWSFSYTKGQARFGVMHYIYMARIIKSYVTMYICNSEILQSLPLYTTATLAY